MSRHSFDVATLELHWESGFVSRQRHFSVKPKSVATEFFFVETGLAHLVSRHSLLVSRQGRVGRVMLQSSACPAQATEHNSVHSMRGCEHGARVLRKRQDSVVWWHPALCCATV